MTTKLPYTEWKRGDILRVIDREDTDPFAVGQLVIHDSVDACPTPSCYSRGWRWTMTTTELEFHSRGLPDAYNESKST